MAGAVLMVAMLALTMALFLVAYRLRQRFGLAPLYMTLGSVEMLKYLISGTVHVELPTLGEVAPGSVVFYTATLGVLLLVYARSGLSVARELLWALLYVNIALALLMVLVSTLMSAPESVLLAAYDPALLRSGAWRIVAGTSLLFVGALAAIVLFDRLRRFLPGFAPAAFVSLALITSLDTILYHLVTVRAEFWLNTRVLGDVIGKWLVLLLWVPAAAFYLRHFDRGEVRPEEESGYSGDRLLAALTYRARIAELEQLLQRDPLTGVLNRRFLESSLPEQLTLDRRRGVSTSVLMFDIDHFKTINDRYGHAVGDLVLKHVAELIRSSIRRSDAVVRFGGEEFLVIAPGTERVEAYELALRILGALREATRFEGGPSRVTATAGVATAPADGHEASGLLRAADQRLYRGKRAGRDCVIAE